jgi:hypothetical protein
MIEVSVQNEKNEPIIVAADSIKPPLSTNDERKWDLRLKRDRDYIINVKVNGKVLETTRCSLSYYSLIHISIVETDSIRVVTSYKTYTHPWDFGFVIGAE